MRVENSRKTCRSKYSRKIICVNLSIWNMLFKLFVSRKMKAKKKREMERVDLNWIQFNLIRSNSDHTITISTPNWLKFTDKYAIFRAHSYPHYLNLPTLLISHNIKIGTYYGNILLRTEILKIKLIISTTRKIFIKYDF